MKPYINTLRFSITTADFLVRVISVFALLSLLGCQSKEKMHFPEITMPSADDYFSSISPDNNLIAIVRHVRKSEDDGVKNNLLVSNTLKNNWLPLFSTDNLPASYLVSAFSPDSTMLAVKDGQGSLWIFETKQWTIIQEFHYPWIQDGPIIWSPNSKSLIVFGKDEIATSLLMLDGNYRYLLSHSDFFPNRVQVERFDFLSYGFFTVWSPDGKRIAYISQITSDDQILESQLWILDISSNQRTMLYRGQFGGETSWSPDGKKISFTTREKIQMYDFQSNKVETVYKVKGSPKLAGIYPATTLWSPNSRQIAFTVYESISDTGEILDEGGLYIISLPDTSLEIIPKKNISLLQWVHNTTMVVKNTEIANQPVITTLSLTDK